jgi:hypothetical protein
MEPLDGTRRLHQACNGIEVDLFQLDEDVDDGNFEPDMAEYGEAMVEDYVGRETVLRRMEERTDCDDDNQSESLVRHFNDAKDFCEWSIRLIGEGKDIGEIIYYVVTAVDKTNEVAELASSLISEMDDEDDHSMESDFVGVIKSLARRLNRVANRLQIVYNTMWMRREEGDKKLTDFGSRLYTVAESVAMFRQRLPVILDELRRIYVDFESCGETDVFQLND